MEKYSHFNIDEFIADERFSRYRTLARENELFRELFSFLSQPEQLLKLEHASKERRPALSGVLEILESDTYNQLFPKDQPGDFNRQAVGAVARFLLEPLGWERDHNKRIPGNRVLSNAMMYKQTGNGEYELEIVVKLKFKDKKIKIGEYEAVLLDVSKCTGTDKFNPFEQS